MQINLRKANAIQHEIRAALKGMRRDVRISVTEFEDAGKAIDKALAAYDDSLAKSEALTTALFEIRGKVGSANETGGINAALTRVAEIGELISLYTPATADSAQCLDDMVLAGKVAKLKEQPKDSSGYYGRGEETVQTGIFDETALKAAKTRIATLKREKRDLQDQLLAMNVKVTITLSDAAVAALTEEGIL
jgi:hypothetical protein